MQTGLCSLMQQHTHRDTGGCGTTKHDIKQMLWNIVSWWRDGVVAEPTATFAVAAASRCCGTTFVSISNLTGLLWILPTANLGIWLFCGTGGLSTFRLCRARVCCGTFVERIRQCAKGLREHEPEQDCNRDYLHCRVLGLVDAVGASYPDLTESQIRKHLSRTISQWRCLQDTQTVAEAIEMLQFQSACFQLCNNSAEKGCSNRRGASDCRGRIPAVMTSQQRTNWSAEIVTEKTARFRAGNRRLCRAEVV